MNKIERLQTMKAIFQKQNIFTLNQLKERVVCNERTVQRYLKELNAITSFTHSGRYVTLANIPQFDDHGVWFYEEIGFTKYGSSLELIIELINSSAEGMTREEIQKITRIHIFQQIQVLLQRERLHRVKVGNKYVYVPEDVTKNKKKMLMISGARQTESSYEQGLNVNELIDVLRVVMQEGNIKIGSLKQWIRKYSLKVSVDKLEKLIFRCNLDEKKRHRTIERSSCKIPK